MRDPTEFAVKRMKRIIMIGVLCLLVATVVASIVAFCLIRNGIKTARTQDTIALIITAMDRRLNHETWESGYDPVLETKREFPEVRVRDGRIVDEWGSPIEVTIKEDQTGFSFNIVSPGKDGRLGTSDDLRRSGRISK